MASGLLLVSGSPLIGSPIIYKVTAANLSGEPSFHRIKITISAGLQHGNYESFEMSTPVNNGETVQVDISSALRAVADDYFFTPEPPDSYPYVSFSLSACDDYMLNGELFENMAPISNSGGRAIFGTYSDLERLLAGDNKTTLNFTRKPISPEIVCVGETYVRPRQMSVSIGNILQGPSSVVYNITQEGAQSVAGAQLYALPANQADRYLFRFINGLGCLESLSVCSLRTTEISINTEQFNIAKPETFSSFARGVVIKKNDFEKWRFSSGPLDRLWQEWFLHEFIMARWVWINIEGSWIPCHVLPEETITGMNRTDGSMLEIMFSIQFDITGSPFASLAI